MLVSPNTLAQNPRGLPAVISGTIVLPGGQPATGVTVWLVKGAYNKTYRPLAKVTTDERSRFAFAGLDPKAVFDYPEEHPHLLARDGQGRLGWSPTLWPYNWVEVTHKIQLIDTGDVRGRLVDGAGTPIDKGTWAVQKGEPIDNEHGIKVEGRE
jgi:hypothetical protein